MARTAAPPQPNTTGFKQTFGTGIPPSKAYWPCRLDLASTGSMCEMRDITSLVAGLRHLKLDQSFGLDIDDLVATVMAPITFGPQPEPPAGPLAEAARAAGVSPAQILICCLAAAAVIPNKTAPSGGRP